MCGKSADTTVSFLRFRIRPEDGAQWLRKVENKRTTKKIYNTTPHIPIKYKRKRSNLSNFLIKVFFFILRYHHFHFIAQIVASIRVFLIFFSDRRNGMVNEYGLQRDMLGHTYARTCRICRSRLFLWFLYYCRDIYNAIDTTCVSNNVYWLLMVVDSGGCPLLKSSQLLSFFSVFFILSFTVCFAFMS